MSYPTHGQWRPFTKSTRLDDTLVQIVTDTAAAARAINHTQRIIGFFTWHRARRGVG